jgi:hypothetical protein
MATFRPMPLLPSCRHAVLLAALLVLAGCAGLSRAPRTVPATAAAVPVGVFHDGFHAGFLLPVHRPELAWIDTTQDDLSRQASLVELGFAADNWIAVRDPGSGTTCATALWGGTGVLMGAYLPPDGVRPPRGPDQPVRRWEFRLVPSQWQRLVAYLRAWADLEIRRVRPPGVNQILLFSPRRWMLYRNCNDFVIDGLRAAGLESRWRLGYTADGFQSQLDALAEAVPADHALEGP